MPQSGKQKSTVRGDSSGLGCGEQEKYIACMFCIVNGFPCYMHEGVYLPRKDTKCLSSSQFNMPPADATAGSRTTQQVEEAPSPPGSPADFRLPQHFVFDTSALFLL